jgi:hypothetical protein
MPHAAAPCHLRCVKFTAFACRFGRAHGYTPSRQTGSVVGASEGEGAGMPEFMVGDVVKVEMPRGYSNRGVLGISVMFTTWPEARFDGGVGTITELNPIGPYGVHQYLVDFRTQDNGRLVLPWGAQWFREEWLTLVERVPAMAGAVAATPGATVAADQSGPGAVRPVVSPSTAVETGAAVAPDGDGYTRLPGMTAPPAGFPIKGIERDRHYMMLSDPGYEETPGDIFFVDEATAQQLGYTRRDASGEEILQDPAASMAGGHSWGEDSERSPADIGAAPATAESATAIGEVGAQGGPGRPAADPSAGTAELHPTASESPPSDPSEVGTAPLNKQRHNGATDRRTT